MATAAVTRIPASPDQRRANAQAKAAAISRQVGLIEQWVHLQADGTYQVEGSRGESYRVSDAGWGTLVCSCPAQSYCYHLAGVEQLQAEHRSAPARVLPFPARPATCATCGTDPADGADGRCDGCRQVGACREQEQRRCAHPLAEAICAANHILCGTCGAIIARCLP